jgi:hypothetical protein
MLQEHGYEVEACPDGPGLRSPSVLAAKIASWSMRPMRTASSWSSALQAKVTNPTAILIIRLTARFSSLA